jgi:hydrogenase maturation protease
MTCSGPGAGRVLVIGVGNGYRGDDAAGLAVAEQISAMAPPGVRVIGHEGEPASVMEYWDRRSAVYLVDAVASGGVPGSVYRFDAASTPLAARFSRRGTHAVGVAETIELARALGRLPQRLIAYGIEGRSFAAGAGLSSPVRRAVAVACAQLLEELGDRRLMPDHPPA